ncbi:nucleoid-associated protein, partial [Microcoleus sp. A2-C2]|uniref:nucleoid-associated protein n=1 Tax=Microcoleus sp. A2-C2 TaxID=2818530 RepID=UPI002FD4277F
LTHESDIALNEVAHHANSLFTKDIDFIDFSQRIATHLYTSTHHPNIASGDLFIILFNKIKNDEKYCSAIGIYKSESKNQYISTKIEGGAPELEVLTGINPELIDKGALLTEGSTWVYALDRFSKRTKYWMEDFLKAKQIPDEKTKSTIAIGLIEKVRNDIENPIARQKFGQDIITLCSEREEILGSELRDISEQYVEEGFWDDELKIIAQRKSLMDLDEIKIPVKKFEPKLKKTLSKVDLGNDIVLTIPTNLSFNKVEFDINGKSILVNITLENKNG